MKDRPDSNTYFAPAGRATTEKLRQETQALATSELITTLLDAIPDYLMVLNHQRQIVAVNQRLLEAFGIDLPERLIGLRPGEAVNCVHCNDGPDGCGTGRNCAVCGAVMAILASQETGTPQQRECQLMLGADSYHALDLDVLATPVTVEGERYTVLALRDISAEKRRQVMERIFFHDILNSAGGIRGLASLLVEGANPEADQEFKEWMVTLSDNLIEEINHQRRLFQAERGDYKPNFEEVALSELVYDLVTLYEHHERTPGRYLDVEDEAPNTIITTDRPLLRRVVGNMILNALEASQQGDRVLVKTDVHDGRIRISVINPGEIPAEVQLHLFKRSFSTKGREGRGLGTYSMKLLGERYLKGIVDFVSANGSTTFFIELPRDQETGSTS